VLHTTLGDMNTATPAEGAIAAPLSAPLGASSAVAFAIGCFLAHADGAAALDEGLASSGAVGAMILAFGALVFSFRASLAAARPARWCLLSSVGCAGVAWSVAMAVPSGGWRTEFPIPPIDHVPIAAVCGPPLLAAESGTLAQIRGRIVEAPEVVAQGTDATAAFARTSPRVAFELDDVVIERAEPGDPAEPGNLHNNDDFAVRGIIAVRVESDRTFWKANDIVRARGWLRPSRPFSNPHIPRPGEGEPALMRGPPRRVVGSLTVPQPGLVEQYAKPDAKPVAGAAPPSIGLSERWQARRAALRVRAAAIIAGALPSWSSDHARQLLMAMLLGRTDVRFDVLEERFAEAGLAHLIAISGFNLAVLALAINHAASLLRVPRRIGDGATVLTVVAYALLVESQPSVTRAALTAAAIGLAAIACRRWRGDAILGLASTAILVADPSQILRPGYQLTFAAVLALRYLVPRLSERWYRERGDAPVNVAEAIRHSLRALIVASIAVWLATTPFAIWHFGRLAPLAIPLSIVAIPVGALLLVVGYATAALACVTASLAYVPATIAVVLCEILIWLANCTASITGPWFRSIGADAAWCAAAVITAWWWCRCRLRRQAVLAATALTIVWLVAAIAAMWPVPRPLFEVTMLAIGDGSAYIIRSQRACVLFDAGSSSTTSVVRTIVRPALAAMGVGRIDAIIVSHPDLDHYSAVPDLMIEERVSELIVTERFHAAVQADPDGAPAMLARTAERCRVSVTIAGRGQERTFGGTRWTWLHPPPGFQPRRDNDSSQVICVEVSAATRDLSRDAVTTRRLLFTGDVEAEGAVALLEASGWPGIPALGVDVCELPHHGSWRPAVLPLLDRAQPALVLQSTAARRFQRDRFGDALDGVQRMVTCRDGAVRVTLVPDGRLLVHRWSNARWIPAGLVAERSAAGSRARDSESDHATESGGAERRATWTEVGFPAVEHLWDVASPIPFEPRGPQSRATDMERGRTFNAARPTTSVSPSVIAAAHSLKPAAQPSRDETLPRRGSDRALLPSPRSPAGRWRSSQQTVSVPTIQSSAGEGLPSNRRARSARTRSIGRQGRPRGPPQ